MPVKLGGKRIIIKLIVNIEAISKKYLENKVTVASKI